jgi:hypothetical protein
MADNFRKKGISSLQLAKDIDVTQKTAWFMSQRIRECFGIENHNELKELWNVMKHLSAARTETDTVIKSRIF